MARSARLAALAALAAVAVITSLVALHGNGTHSVASPAHTRVAHRAPSVGNKPVVAVRPTPVRSPRPLLPARRFRLVLDAARIRVPVAPLSVASHEVVDPPHATAREWNTAVWIEQAVNPALSRLGTTYIYGHACEFISCAFNRLVHTRVGDIATIAMPGGRLSYRVDRIGLGTKYANSLPRWAADSTVPDRIVLVTCAYNDDGSSTDNLIVAARLIPPARVTAAAGAAR